MLIYALSFLLGIGLFALKNTLQISLVEWGVTTRVLQLVTNCDQLKMIKNLITDLLPFKNTKLTYGKN
jgi:hypothetical protein